MHEVVRIRCNWAHYERATAKEIMLKPPEHALAALENDYRHMQNMIFGVAATGEMSQAAG